MSILKEVDKLVKVIQYGKKRKKCFFCDSLLEYSREDVQNVKRGINEWGGEIICPNCGEKINVT